MFSTHYLFLILLKMFFKNWFGLNLDCFLLLSGLVQCDLVCIEFIIFYLMKKSSHTEIDDTRGSISSCIKSFPISIFLCLLHQNIQELILKYIGVWFVVQVGGTTGDDICHHCFYMQGATNSFVMPPIHWLCHMKPPSLLGGATTV